MKLNSRRLMILEVLTVLLALLLVQGGVFAEPPNSPALPSQIIAPEKPEAPVNKPISGIVEMTLREFPTKTSPLSTKQLSGTEEMAFSDSQVEQFHLDAKKPFGPNVLINRDFSFRPQNEPSIAIDPNNHHHLVVGYNDFRQDVPHGGGFSTSFNGGLTWHDGMIPFPLLYTVEGIVEPPLATGDPAIAIASDGTVYYSTIGLSQSWCENGIFVSRSDNGGITWWTPVVVPGRQGPRVQGVVVYHPFATDCSIFHDKEYMAVDNSGGQHDGRVYVTWTRYAFDELSDYLESPIYLAYSDDKAVTWTVIGEINGKSEDLCEFQTDTSLDGDPVPACDENQFSYPVVGADGTLYVHFLNAQNESKWSAPGDFDDQILVVRINPDTFNVEGPFHVTMLANGLTNYPIVAPDYMRQTICNGGWRLNAAGNIAIGPDDELYIVFADNRNGKEFSPFPYFLADTIFLPGQTFACEEGLFTDTDVFLLKSTDRGESWFNPATGAVGEPLEVTNDPPVRDQWFPWVTVSDNGTVHIVYHDRREDPNNYLTHTYVATSRDGGTSWNEHRVSKVASDYHASYFGLGIFIGDYNNIAASGEKAFALWTDARSVSDTDILMKVVRPPWRWHR